MLVTTRPPVRSGSRSRQGNKRVTLVEYAIAVKRVSRSCHDPPLMPLLILVLVGTYACKGPFWALSSEWLAPSVADAGLAQINALGVPARRT